MTDTSPQPISTIGVIGLGYVGLPLSVVFADAGYRVIGFDVNASIASALNAGHSHIEDVPSAALAEHTAADRFFATTDFDLLRQVDAVVICVPTPLRKTRDPDVSFIIKATENVAKRLQKGQLIVLESTTYPGTTREIILPMLEAGGFEVGTDFFLAFSPERVDPGRSDFTTQNTPKVVGGITSACQAAALGLYEKAIEHVVPVSSPEVAEMTKVFENTFRAVNIGLANELLIMCDKLGLDAWEVIDAAATKPFGFMRFTPGPGLGGHCIPIDPHYLSWKLKSLDYTARFIELASEINTSMPMYWVQRVQDQLNTAQKSINGSRILVIGAAYKKDVSDLRESPALDLMLLLQSKGADLAYHDPHIPVLRHGSLQLSSVSDLDRELHRADCVVIATDHSTYNWEQIAAAPLVVDTRAALPRTTGQRRDQPVTEIAV